MKTVSEQRFETYLDEHGFKEFDYEPIISGTTRRPDYRVKLVQSEIFFEVKEFEPPAELPTGGSCDLYPPIRSKIHRAREKFRALKGKMCGIVLANPNGAFVSLEPMFIYGAMLGNVGIRIPFDTAAGVGDFERATQTFLSGGKMLQDKNTTISAICVLDVVAEGSRRFAIRVAQLRRQTGQARTPKSIIVQTASEAQGNDSGAPLRHLRIQVYENPYAVAPLVEAFGMGPWDERFGVRNGRFLRVFTGSSLAALEGDESAAGVEGPDPFHLRRA